MIHGIRALLQTGWRQIWTRAIITDRRPFDDDDVWLPMRDVTDRFDLRREW